MFACLTYLPALVRLHSELAIQDADRVASAAIIDSAISCLTRLKLLHLTCHPALLTTTAHLPSIFTRSKSLPILPHIDACSTYERVPEAQRLTYLHWPVEMYLHWPVEPTCLRGGWRHGPCGPLAPLASRRGCHSIVQRAIGKNPTFIVSSMLQVTSWACANSGARPCRRFCCLTE